MLKFTLILIGSLLIFGCKNPTNKYLQECKNEYSTSGERAGCIIGVYSEKHKVKNSCNVLTACSLKFNYQECNEKRIYAIIKEISERNFSKTYIGFTNQLRKHMETVATSHPIKIVNSCRKGRKIFNPSHNNKNKTKDYKVLKTPLTIKVSSN
jgi:hypothetical protein